MIWQFVLDKLKSGQSMYLIVVSETLGSSPGKVGFKMAVSSDGEISGSIGGGVMEFRMVELARKELAVGGKNTFLKRQVHSSEAEEDKSGMICSGEQTHIFIYLSTLNLKICSDIVAAISSGKTGLLHIEPKRLEFKSAGVAELPAKHEFNHNGNSWYYSEVIGIKDRAYIFGAGHISLPLTHILSLLDFWVEVYDNRKELVTFTSNNLANKKEVIDFDNASKYVMEGNSTYCLIMTFGHKFDEMILRQLLPLKVGYIGMIGSKSKVKAIFDNLLEEGYSPDQLAKVCSPVGLPIGSQTPAEIAVSIAAQIVQWRNGL
ncbi:MAG TPA: XdhC family protein [Tenuifilaceae bacterium]|nr:XdhC family protein [Bacteroidales bacterium]HNY09750.1 XdhC family protein [Tenuifilaceae bacterium]NLI88473.1 XdhC family protein [Bacteroidales bacterium]HOG73008.1 XdhC family protein [Tenuifilaceae bacterium]HOY72551.1 XdhC family protein [Tenuifilaceae bacterium]